MHGVQNTASFILGRVISCNHGVQCNICCWLWTGGLDTSGYGKVRCNGKQISPHRVIYEAMYHMTLTSDQFVLHTCDKRTCCNWNHLYLGTFQDNMNDKVSRNRQTKGTQQTQARLNDSKVYQIRRLYYSSGWRQMDLAKLFKVSQMVINRIINCKDWKHLQGELLHSVAKA